MARPRKYFTAEELRLAKCRKSKKWYDGNRSAAARSASSTQKASKSEAKTKGVAPSTPHGLSPSMPAYWLSRLEGITVKLKKLFNQNDPKQYVEGLYNDYIRDSATQPLDAALEALNELDKLIKPCFQSILQLSGVGKELRKVEMVCNEVNGVTKAIEEVLCHAMSESHEELRDLYNRRALLFQSLT